MVLATREAEQEDRLSPKAAGQPGQRSDTLSPNSKTKQLRVLILIEQVEDKESILALGSPPTPSISYT